jgi:hypothetical protein
LLDARDLVNAGGGGGIEESGGGGFAGELAEGGEFLVDARGGVALGFEPGFVGLDTGAVEGRRIGFVSSPVKEPVQGLGVEPFGDRGGDGIEDQVP